MPHPTAEDATILDVNLNPMRADGQTIGELMLRGNTVMKGYLKNPKATAGRLRRRLVPLRRPRRAHPDSYLEIKDRSKDIIISGGENISSLEVEEVLYRHPDIMEAAVVAHPDEKWGEVPHAFVTPKPGAEDRLTEERCDRILPGQHGAVQGPAICQLRAAAQDQHGEDPEIRTAAAAGGSR